MKQLKATFKAGAVVASLLMLTSCANLLGPRTVELSLAQLQEGLSRKFPFNNRFLELFDVRVTNPRLSLDPYTNRLITTLDASLAPPFMQRSWNGSFTLSGVPQIDPVRQAVVLTDPRVENFTPDFAGGSYGRQISRIGTLLAEQLMPDIPLYTFDAQKFSYGGMRFLPTKINTSANGLVVTFEPAR